MMKAGALGGPGALARTGEACAVTGGRYPIGAGPSEPAGDDEAASHSQWSAARGLGDTAQAVGHVGWLRRGLATLAPDSTSQSRPSWAPASRAKRKLELLKEHHARMG